MPEQLTQAKRRRLLTRSLEDAVSQFGFRYHAGSYFSRERNLIVDAFSYQFSRSNFRFNVIYGVSAPDSLKQIRDNAILNLDSKYPALTISPLVDEQNEFGCKYEEHILSAADKIAGFFSATVVPWLHRFQTPDDIIAEYHRVHIGTERPDATDAPQKVLRWTVYGLMIYNSGKRHDSVHWLEAALQHWSSRTKPTAEEQEWVRIITSTGVGT
jgi:hypothetical protein